jgi:hypothetical protein
VPARHRRQLRRAAELYTDDEEVLFEAARPILLNGIEEVVSRPDLGDRAIFLTLAPIREAQRRPEAELWREFETARPLILGALLHAVVRGLQRISKPIPSQLRAHDHERTDQLERQRVRPLGSLCPEGR